MNQELLFDEWKLTCHKLDSLKVFIQNDFDQMLEDDDYDVKKDTQQAILDFNNQYSQLIIKISELKYEINQLLNKYAKIED